MSRLPDNYEAPAIASNYTKLKEGDNKIRILTAPVIGYEYFTVENKPREKQDYVQRHIWHERRW